MHRVDDVDRARILMLTEHFQIDVRRRGLSRRLWWMYAVVDMRERSSRLQRIENNIAHLLGEMLSAKNFLNRSEFLFRFHSNDTHASC
jgi:hypothetical protein